MEYESKEEEKRLGVKHVADEDLVPESLINLEKNPNTFDKK